MSDPFDAPPTPAAAAPNHLGAGGPSGGEPGVFGAPDLPDVPDVPVVTAADTPARARRSPAKLVGAIAGVAAIVAAGTFAVVRINDNSSAGGAATPVDVGHELIDALEHEDLLAVVDLLLPGERETFRDPLLRTLDHLKRLEVLDDSATAESIGGLDIHFSESSVVEHPTNVDDISTIELDGTVTASVDGAQVPIGSLLLDEAFGGERPDMDVAGQPEPAGSQRFAVVQEDGRWYLSLFYSIADAARGDAEIPAAGLQPVGADTPEGALDALLQSTAKLDLTSMLQVIDPTEAEALLRYAPMFLDDAQQALDGLDLDLAITDTSFTASGDGDRRSLTVDALTVTLTNPDSGDTKSLTYRDGCLSGDLLDLMGGEAKPVCMSDAGDGAIDQQVSDAIEQMGIGDPELATKLVNTIRDALADYEPSGIAVHEVDGRWYVSPLRTYYELFDDVLAALDAGELRAIIDDAKAFVHSMDVGSMFGDDPLDYTPINGDSSD